MAKLPGYTNRQVTGRSVNVEKDQVSQGLGESASKAFAGVSQLVQVQQQMQQREARDFTIESQNKTSVALAEAKVQVTQDSKTGSEYTSGIKTFIEHQKSQALEAAPTQTAADASAKYYDNLMVSELEKAIPLAANMNAKNSARVVNDSLQIGISAAFQSPSEYDTSLQDGIAIINTSDVPESKKAQAISQFDNELTFSRFKGLIKNDPQTALTELQSGSWNSKIDTNQLMNLTREAEQQVKSVQATDTKKLSGEITDYISYKSSGGQNVTEFNKQDLVATYGQEKGDALYSQITDVNAFAEDYGKVELASYEDVKGLVDKNLVTGPENFNQENKQQNMMLKAVQKRNAELADDPAKYVMKSQNVKNEFDKYIASGDGRGFAQASLAEQQRLGVPNGYENILSKQQASSMVETYNQGGENAAVFMSGLKQQFGDYTPQVLNNLAAAGLSPNAVTVAILPEGGRAATYLAQADKEGLKVLKETIAKDDYDDIKSNVNGSLSEYRETTYNPTTYAQIKGSVELLATKYLSAGLYENSDDALDAAANDVINDRYEFVDNYRVPQDIDSSKVEQGIDSTLSTIKNIPLQIPFSTLPDDVSKELYLERLQPKALTMNDDSGVVMVDQFNQPILTEKGEIIKYSWDEIQGNINGPEKGTREYMLQESMGIQ